MRRFFLDGPLSNQLFFHFRMFFAGRPRGGCNAAGLWTLEGSQSVGGFWATGMRVEVNCGILESS